MKTKTLNILLNFSFMSERDQSGLFKIVPNLGMGCCSVHTRCKSNVMS